MATKTVKNRLRINQTKEMTLKQLYDEHMEYSKARNFRPQTLENNEFNFIVLSDYFGEDCPCASVILVVEAEGMTSEAMHMTVGSRDSSRRHSDGHLMEGFRKECPEIPVGIG